MKNKRNKELKIRNQELEYIPNNIAQNYFWQAGCMDN
jgi:hypothetical protein